MAGETTTTNYGWTKPVVGDTDDIWGGFLNGDLDSIDSIVHSIQVNALPVTGVTDGSNATPGQVGEFILSIISAPGVTLANGVASNVTSIALTAGDWEVGGEGWVVAGPGGATSMNASLTTASGQLVGGPSAGASRFSLVATIPASQTEVLSLSPCRVSVAASTTMFLTALAGFASGTCTAYGKIWARRTR